MNSNAHTHMTVSTGAPQGHVLIPLLFTLLTHSCVENLKSYQVSC